MRNRGVGVHGLGLRRRDHAGLEIERPEETGTILAGINPYLGCLPTRGPHGLGFGLDAQLGFVFGQHDHVVEVLQFVDQFFSVSASHCRTSALRRDLKTPSGR